MLLVLLATSVLADTLGTVEDIQFSPGPGCKVMWIRQISQAQKTAKFMVYNFTEADIIQSVCQAQKRGVKLVGVFDRSNLTQKASGLKAVYAAGVECWVDRRHSIMHDKLLVSDGAMTITGSFNPTKNGVLHNAENDALIKGKAAADRYLENFESHRAHSVRYTGGK